MTIALRSSANVVNGTAGTSVTVALPAGTIGTDVLVAFVAQTGTGTISTPAGWTLIGSQVGATNVTVAAFWRTGAVAGTTWTLGASVRNWGWVGAYTGVDASAPVISGAATGYPSAGTVFDGPAQTRPPFARLLSAVGAVRAASGTGTTWTELSGELFDATTNGGAGIDITGAVSDSPVGGFDEFSASQTQTQAVAWTVMLQAAFVGLNLALPILIRIEAAFGANPDGDPAAWTWTDISQYAFNEQVPITKGRGDWSGNANPSEIRFALLNGDGRFTPDNPTSPYYPNITRNLPIRVSLPYGYNPPTERATAFARSWRLSFDGSKDNPIVRVICKGRTSRAQRGSRSLQSAMRRSVSSSARLSTPVAPRAYWPLEDGSSSTSAASAVGGAPMSVALITFAGDSTLTGSAAVPTIQSGGQMVGPVLAYAATGQWCVLWAMKLPVAYTASGVGLIWIHTTGTAPLWRIDITPAVPDTIGIRAFDATGAQVLANDIAMVEADFYGTWMLFSLGVKQNGANIDYTMSFASPAAATTISGTLNAFTHGNVANVEVVTGPGLAGDSIGHIAVYTDPAFDNFFDPIYIAGALNGYAGETTTTRFQRLCIEEGIPNTSQSAGSQFLTLGPQPIGSVLNALGEAESVDDGLIHDGGIGGALVFNTRSARQNAAVAMTLNSALFQVPSDFSAIFDDAEIANDVTASRTGGSSARYVASSNVIAEGTYEDPLSLNLQDDSQLRNVAGWRANRGTAPGMRYPQLSFDLHANPQLVRAWLACGVGSRVKVTGLPSAHGPSDVDVFIEGYTETLDAFTWTVVANCSPARPFDVFVLEGTGNTGRLDSGSSTLNGGVSTTATSLSVATATGDPLWTTGAVTFDIEIAGERLSVTNIAGSTSPQTFTVTRSVNGVVKAQANLAQVKLWHASVLAL